MHKKSVRFAHSFADSANPPIGGEWQTMHHAFSAVTTTALTSVIVVDG